MNNRFRREVYQSFEQRADAGMDLVDALTSAPVVESPVGLSESPLFRRRFSSVYDFLKSGRIAVRSAAPGVVPQPTGRSRDDCRIRSLCGGLHERSCAGSRDLAGPWSVEERQNAPDRSGPCLFLAGAAGGEGHLLVYAVGHSSCANREHGQPGRSEQVATLAGSRASRPKVVVADSLYCNVAFLSVFLTLQSVYALVRIRSNRVLYEEPPERQPGQRGRPRKHGAKFKLSAPSREA